MIESVVTWLLSVLAIPQIGLGSVFIICTISATLVPLGSEPAVFAVIKANGDLFWPAIAVATVGNTLGGAINYWLGFGAKQTFAKERHTRWFGWLVRYGPKTMLIAWLPVIGDPLCSLAGWLKMPFWPSIGYMAVGKFLRYLCMTWLLLQVPNSWWQWLVR
jgi:membrane protein YqaA with SNARE-associated domain